MKKIIIALLVLAMMIMVVGCYPIGVLNDEKGKSNGTVDEKKQQVVDMFMNYGTYDEDGYYKIANNVYKDSERESHTYIFTYHPIEDIFRVHRGVGFFDDSALFTSDGVVVTFRWENKATPNMTAYHSLVHRSSGDRISEISFYFSIEKINSDMSLGGYTYEVVENSFASVSQSQKDQYVKIFANYAKEAMMFAQSTVSAYTDDITLW